MRRPISLRGRTSAGFSLVELLVVMAIIVIMAAVIVPPIANWIRAYRVRAAMQQVASDISAARMRAVSKNVNLGVTFAVTGNDTYQVVVEDDQDAQTAPNWQTIANEDWPTVLGMPAQAGTVQSLPVGVQFENPANCAAPSGGVVATAADTWGLRFKRLGTGCGLNVASCGGLPANVPGYANYIDIATAGTVGLATLCVRQTTTNLRRWVTVSTGGRVITQP
jgi:prepilin-type N-terminal cleavage/methylation domain-containing protein